MISGEQESYMLMWSDDSRKPPQSLHMNGLKSYSRDSVLTTTDIFGSESFQLHFKLMLHTEPHRHQGEYMQSIGLSGIFDLMGLHGFSGYC